MIGQFLLGLLLFILGGVSVFGFLVWEAKNKIQRENFIVIYKVLTKNVPGANPTDYSTAKESFDKFTNAVMLVEILENREKK